MAGRLMACGLHGKRRQRSFPNCRVVFPSLIPIAFTGEVTAKMTSNNAMRTTSTLAQAPPGGNGFSLISNEKLIELFAAMVKSRMIAERAGLLKEQGRLAGDFKGGVGREASISGVAVDLLPEDTLCLSQCDFVSGFIKGLPLHKVFSSLASQVNGHRPSPPDSDADVPVSVLPPASTVDVQLTIACAVALACKTAKNRRIAVAFCGDGAASLECWRETLTFAGLRELPILFVHHDHAKEEQGSQGTGRRHKKTANGASARQVPAIAVDGNDAVAVYRVASESIARARRGRGPTLIECKACGLGNDGGIPPAIAGQFETRDPIGKMEIYLRRKGLFRAEMKQQIAAEFSRELDAATRFLND